MYFCLLVLKSRSMKLSPNISGSGLKYRMWMKLIIEETIREWTIFIFANFVDNWFYWTVSTEILCVNTKNTKNSMKPPKYHNFKIVCVLYHNSVDAKNWGPKQTFLKSSDFEKNPGKWQEKLKNEVKY